MLFWCFGCLVVGTTVGAAAAQFLNSAAIWPSVTLALLGIFIAVFSQRYADLQKTIASVSTSLAAVHRELSGPEASTSALRMYAAELEGALAPKPRGPFVLPRQALFEYELEACLMHLLSTVSGLPVSRATAAETDELRSSLEGSDPQSELAQFAWELRGHLLHPRR
jgi:hypothetical protein